MSDSQQCPFQTSLKGTVTNRTFNSTNKGLLEITFTVPLREKRTNDRG